MEDGRPVFETLVFLDYELMPAARRLLRGGQPVAVGGRAFDLLVLLASHAGEVVAKRTLMQGVWPDTVVEDINLRAQVRNHGGEPRLRIGRLAKTYLLSA